jgi:hypothetical protein
MSVSLSKISRIEGVLRDATNDLQNAELPDFLFNKLVPVTTKASDVVPKVAKFIPLPFVDRVGAFALSVPLKAVKIGYSLIPREEKDQEAARGQQEFIAALEMAGIDLDAEYQKLNLDANSPESLKAASFQDQELTFLVEVIGCENLIASDINSAVDPYVRVKFGGQLLHATKHHTIGKNALLLSSSIKDLFLSGGVKGLTLEVCDFDSMTSDDVLGTAVVPPKDIYNAHEERLGYPLLIEDEDGFYLESGGSIAIRIRRATDYEKEFLEEEYESNDTMEAAQGLVGLMVPYSHAVPNNEESSVDDSTKFTNCEETEVYDSSQDIPVIGTLSAAVMILVLLVMPLLTTANVHMVQNGGPVTFLQVLQSLLCCFKF